MNPHFFTAPFSLLSFGSGFKGQGSRGGFAAFFRRWYSRIAAFPAWVMLTIREERSPQFFGHSSPLRTR